MGKVGSNGQGKEKRDETMKDEEGRKTEPSNNVFGEGRRGAGEEAGRRRRGGKGKSGGSHLGIVKDKKKREANKKMCWRKGGEKGGIGEWPGREWIRRGLCIGST